MLGLPSIGENTPDEFEVFDLVDVYCGFCDIEGYGNDFRADHFRSPLECRDEVEASCQEQDQVRDAKGTRDSPWALTVTFHATPEKRRFARSGCSEEEEVGARVGLVSEGEIRAAGFWEAGSNGRARHECEAEVGIRPRTRSEERIQHLVVQQGVICSGDEDGPLVEARMIEALERTQAGGFGAAKNFDASPVSKGAELWNRFEQLRGIDIDQNALEARLSKQSPDDSQEHRLTFDFEQRAMRGTRRKGEGIICTSPTRHHHGTWGRLCRRII